MLAGPKYYLEAQVGDEKALKIRHENMHIFFAEGNNKVNMRRI